MLSRVADNLYWTSRYFERAGNCACVLGATWGLMLNPNRTEAKERWRRALLFLGLPENSGDLDPEDAIMQMASDKSNPFSVVSSIMAARDNASQAREEISSEMWEHLNRVYHEVIEESLAADASVGPMTLVTMMQEGSYKFKGITDSTMNHGEGYHFIQLGKYSERACALSNLLDAYYSVPSAASDLDWIALLSSCSAFEAYCKAYTADLQAERVAEFLLLHPDCPHSVRYAADRISEALHAITARSPAHKAAGVKRMAGKLRSSLAYGQIEDLMAGDLHTYLDSVAEQCRSLHASLHDSYIDYPIAEALED